MRTMDLGFGFDIKLPLPLRTRLKRRLENIAVPVIDPRVANKIILLDLIGEVVPGIWCGNMQPLFAQKGSSADQNQGHVFMGKWCFLGLLIGDYPAQDYARLRNEHVGGHLTNPN
jgi:hypothetical protein